MKNTHCQDPRCWILLLMANSNHRGVPLGTEHLSNTHYLVFLFFFCSFCILWSLFFFIFVVYIKLYVWRESLHSIIGLGTLLNALQQRFRQTMGCQAPPPCIPPIQKIEAVNGRGLTTFKRQELKNGTFCLFQYRILCLNRTFHC